MDRELVGGGVGTSDARRERVVRCWKATPEAKSRDVRRSAVGGQVCLQSLEEGEESTDEAS